MSQLPKGTLASRNFLHKIILEGALAKAYAFAPWLDFPVVRNILEALLVELLIDPTLDEATALLLAGKYVLDQKHFDKSFIALKILERQGASKETLERALQNAEMQMAKFIRRSNIS